MRSFARVLLGLFFFFLSVGVLSGKVWGDWSPALPDHTVTAWLHHPGFGGTTYWEIVFPDAAAGGTDIADGLDVSNNVSYRGWCVDEDGRIYNGQTYTFDLYSSYDPQLLVDHDHFNHAGHRPRNDLDLVNYILNNKPSSFKLGEKAWEEIQEAIWYFVNGGHMPAEGTTARAIVDDALGHEGFVPGPGEVMAVVLAPDPLRQRGYDAQYTLIEVAVPVPEASTLLLFGAGLSGLLFFVRKRGLIRF